MNLTDEQRDKLINNYARQVVDDMDLKDLCRFAAEVIAHEFEDEIDEYIIATVKAYYPELLEEISNESWLLI